MCVNDQFFGSSNPNIADLVLKAYEEQKQLAAEQKHILSLTAAFEEADSEQIEKMISDQPLYILASVAYIISSPIAIKILSQNSHSSVKEAVAANPSVSPDILYTLLQGTENSRYSRLPYVVTQNQNCDMKCFEWIKNNASTSALLTAMGIDSFPASFLVELLESDNPTVQQKAKQQIKNRGDEVFFSGMPNNFIDEILKN